MVHRTSGGGVGLVGINSSLHTEEGRGVWNSRYNWLC